MIGLLEPQYSAECYLGEREGAKHLRVMHSAVLQRGNSEMYGERGLLKIEIGSVDEIAERMSHLQGCMKIRVGDGFPVKSVRDMHDFFRGEYDNPHYLIAAGRTNRSDSNISAVTVSVVGSKEDIERLKTDAEKPREIAEKLELLFRDAQLYSGRKHQGTFFEDTNRCRVTVLI